MALVMAAALDHCSTFDYYHVMNWMINKEVEIEEEIRNLDPKVNFLGTLYKLVERGAINSKICRLIS